MGSSNSEEYRSLVRPRKSDEWVVLQEKGAVQIWLQISTSRRYLAFPINTEDIDSEQKLQLYSFRKQNRTNLVTVDHILVGDSSLFCSNSHQCHLLVEYIPFRLSSFRNALSFQQTLVVLNSALAGYNILNYIYGPVYTSPDMICINEQGLPKVWINENLSLNEPSKRARYHSDQQLVLGQNTPLSKPNDHRSLEAKMHQCLKFLIKTVEDTSVQRFPLYFNLELQKIRTFEEGEQYISNYCRKNSISLDQKICLEKANRFSPSYNPINSDRVMRNSNAFLPHNLLPAGNRLAQSNIKDQKPTYMRTQLIEPMTFRPIIQTPLNTPYLSSKQQPSAIINNNNRNMNVLQNPRPILKVPPVPSIPYNQTPVTSSQVISIPYNETPLNSSPTGSIPEPPKLSFLQSESEQKTSKIKQSQQQLPNPSQPKKNYSLDQFKHQMAYSLDTSEMHRSYPIEHSFGPIDPNKMAVAQIVERSSSEVSKDSALLRPSIRQSSKQYTQKSKQKNSMRLQEAQSRELGNTDLSYSPRTLQELKLWEQSLFKQSQKRIQNEWSKDRSRTDRIIEDRQDQHNKVILQQNANSIYQYGTQSDLQNYVRDKYSIYLTDTQEIERKLNFQTEQFDEGDGGAQYDYGLYASSFKNKQNYQNDKQHTKLQRNDYGSMSYHVPKPKINQFDTYIKASIPVDPTSNKRKSYDQKSKSHKNADWQPIDHTDRYDHPHKVSDQSNHAKKIKSPTPKASYDRIEERYAKYVKNKDSKNKNNGHAIPHANREYNNFGIREEDSFGTTGRNSAGKTSKTSKSYRNDDQKWQSKHEKEKASGHHKKLQNSSKKQSGHSKGISYSELSELLRN